MFPAVGGPPPEYPTNPIPSQLCKYPSTMLDCSRIRSASDYCSHPDRADRPLRAYAENPECDHMILNNTKSGSMIILKSFLIRVCHYPQAQLHTFHQHIDARNVVATTLSSGSDSCFCCAYCSCPAAPNPIHKLRF